MNPKLLGNPLVAWRDESCLQIGWGQHGVVVESAPPALPGWLSGLDGSRPAAQVVGEAQRLGIPQETADSVLSQLRRAGLLADVDQLRVSIATEALVREPLAEALRNAGVRVTPGADVVVFPQGQLPSMVSAPVARRVIPVWFGARAVHVGPVIDDAVGPCPRCVDLTWTDHDRRWPHLVAQAGSVGLWGTATQLAQAAAAIALLGRSERAVGLEMILDPAHAGPCWRVWSGHPGCRCRTT